MRHHQDSRIQWQPEPRPCKINQRFANDIFVAGDGFHGSHFLLVALFWGFACHGWPGRTNLLRSTRDDRASSPNGQRAIPYLQKESASWLSTRNAPPVIMRPCPLGAGRADRQGYPIDKKYQPIRSVVVGQ
jgi:hypothetical protein